MSLSSFIYALPLRQKLTVLIFTVSCVASLLGFSVYALLNLRTVHENVINNANLIARTVASYSAADLAFLDSSAAAVTLSGLLNVPDVVNAYLFDNKDKLFVSMRNLPAAPPKPWVTGTEYDGYIHIIAPVNFENNVYGKLYLLISREPLQAGIRDAILTFLFLLSVVLSLSLLLAYRLQRYVSQPIQELAAAAKYISESADYSTRLVPPSDDEMGVLYLSFNFMLERMHLREQERDHAHRALINSEAQVRLLLNSTAEAIYGVDSNGICTFVNPACLRMLGYNDKNKLVGQKIHDLIHHTYPDGRPYPAEECAVNIATLASKMANRDDEVHWRADGTSFPVEYWSHPMYKDDILVGSVVTFIDISERKQREKEADDLREQLAQATKMESIGQLTAGIAHDFNNMLGAMMGYSELTQHVLENGNITAASRYQEKILKAVNRAKELIAQMLTFSRVSAAVDTGTTTPVIVLSFVVKEVVALLRSSIPSTIDLAYKVEDEELKARIQPVHLHQILLNLGVNARDSLGEYGKIDISLSKQHFENTLCDACKMTHSGNYAQITVKDSGSSIPVHILNKIFDPFFTTKGVGKGTGMGLSVVHGLVHALGGHIQVESSSTNGTAFNILLPLETAEASSHVITGTKQTANIKGARIMVVDDEEDLSAMLNELLSAHGANVVSFTDSKFALEFFIQHGDNIDLVITDETMPGLSGMHLAEHMLKLQPKLPIILCTGYSEHASPEAVTNIGISAYFRKPIIQNDLLQKITELLMKNNAD